ncbi:hypothetical protein [Vibrio coralliilyticus]|uniref:hypothetical protein n=1 Tax=Vibrio coralliilyticus TaxID=190893 RepID=UPI0017EF58DC|nr:hypothetical protein [Vibrio coralliilyticus]NUW68629.1 hypothetical protein [Vibrio coralliilyticus]
MKKFKNQLSETQVCSISDETGLKDSRLEYFITNIEYQLDAEGVVPRNSFGDIDLNIRRENSYTKSRNQLEKVEKKLYSLLAEIRKYNLVGYTELKIHTSDLGLRHVVNEKSGAIEYEELNAEKYLHALSEEVESLKEYYHDNRNRSGRITECLYKAWCFSIIGDLPNNKSTSVELSDSNAFINVVSIVTSWSIENTKKNISNASWFKQLRAYERKV